jgi:hypothetical protein
MANVGDDAADLAMSVIWRRSGMARAQVTIGSRKIIFPFWRSALDVRGERWLNVGVVENPHYGGRQMARTTMSVKNREALEAAYVESHATVMHYLDQIHHLVHDLPEPESDDLNWAHLGSMNQVQVDLREIVEFLGGHGQ